MFASMQGFIGHAVSLHQGSNDVGPVATISSPMLQGKGIDCLATHPGLAATPLYPKLDKSKPEAVAVNLFEKVYSALWCVQQGVKSHSVLAGGGLCMMPPSCAGVLCIIHLECYSAGVLYVSCTLHVFYHCQVAFRPMAKCP